MTVGVGAHTSFWRAETRTALTVVLALSTAPAVALAGCIEPHPDDDRAREATAAEQASTDRFSGLVSAFDSGDYGALDGLVVFERGRQVFERYASGYDGLRPHTMQSVTKSVTSLLVGIALDRGRLPGVDAPLLDLLPADRRTDLDRSSLRAIRLTDLLTMRSGLEWDEHTAPWSSPENDLGEMYRRSSDWVRHVLTRPLSEQPGTRFRYNSGGTLVLGAVLEAATGSGVETFARSALFEPLGIRSASWRHGGPTGLAHTGGGLYLAPLDLARIGRLLLDGGVWEGERIVSRAWIDESFRAHVEDIGEVAGRRVDYGYLWWILPARAPSDTEGAARPRVVFARGAEGQHLFLVADLDLVVVTTGRSHGAEENAPVDLLLREIVPAARTARGGAR